MSDFTLSREEHINFLLKNFDFKQVYKVMKALNWKWATIDSIPNIKELKKTAKHLLNDIYNDDYVTCISTGGFKVVKHDDFLELEFNISSLDSDIINYGTKYEKMKKSKSRRNKLNIINKYEDGEIL